MGKLVIDLGHGGHDPGAIGPNKSHEADVVLAIGKELDELLIFYQFTLIQLQIAVLEVLKFGSILIRMIS